jgi:DNA-directed RNA polymerase beta subunit
MNLERDTWDVINSYFKHTPNPLVRHHIDSYNDFIQNKIPLIFQNLTKKPPFILIDANDNISYGSEVSFIFNSKSTNNPFLFL